MALLNRMGTLLWEAGGLPILVQLLDDGQVDRQLTASVIRTSGEEGETLLLKLLKFHKNEKVRMAAASVLSYRLPADVRQIQVEIKLDNEEEVNLMESGSIQFHPGQVCKYTGPITSLILEENERSFSE